jgi:hypothetical protein
MTLLGVIVTLVCWVGMIQLQYAKFSVYRKHEGFSPLARHSDLQ